MLPKAAELYRKQISDGLDGSPEAAAKARTILRDMIGEIRLQPTSDGGLWAEYGMHPAILLKGAGSDGRGEALHDVPAVSLRVRFR